MTALADTAGSTAAGKAALREAGLDRLAAKAQAFDDELGEAAEHAMPFLLARRDRLIGIGATPHEASRASKTAAHLDEAGRASLETAILRALAPRFAILTAPRETLFFPQELPEIRPVTPFAEMTPTDLRQKVGAPIAYGGYLCVILKITRLCNLRCVYCKDWSADPSSTMPLSLTSSLIAQLLGGDRACVDLVLHGGEPMMIGRRRFLQFLWLLARHSREGQAVRLHMQSNGTLISDRWLRLLALFSVPVSVSLDGPQAIHDAQRPDTKGRPTAERAREGIARLDRAGLLSGVLIVVSRSILEFGALALVRSLVESGIRSVCLIPERPEPGASPAVSAERFVAFLIEVERARAAIPGCTLAVREIEAVRNLLSDRPSGFCELAGNCVGHFITVEANGDLSHCDKYVGDPQYTVGNLHDTSLDALIDGPAMRRIRAEAQRTAPRGDACRFRHLCQGWCPHESYVSGRSGAACCGLGTLFEALEPIAARDGAPA